MPPRYRKHGEKVFPLSWACQAGHFARVRCMTCRTKRIYRLDDLQKLLGDIECDEVNPA